MVDSTLNTNSGAAGHTRTLQESRDTIHCIDAPRGSGSSDIAMHIIFPIEIVNTTPRVHLRVTHGHGMRDAATP